MHCGKGSYTAGATRQRSAQSSALESKAQGREVLPLLVFRVLEGMDEFGSATMVVSSLLV